MLTKATVRAIARVALLTLLFVVSLSLLIAVARPETGPVEKVVAGAAIVALVVAARPVHRIG
jgi:hypothetical protein